MLERLPPEPCRSCQGRFGPCSWAWSVWQEQLVKQRRVHQCLMKFYQFLILFSSKWAFPNLCAHFKPSWDYIIYQCIHVLCTIFDVRVQNVSNIAIFESVCLSVSLFNYLFGPSWGEKRTLTEHEKEAEIMQNSFLLGVTHTHVWHCFTVLGLIDNMVPAYKRELYGLRITLEHWANPLYFEH